MSTKSPKPHQGNSHSKSKLFSSRPSNAVLQNSNLKFFLIRYGKGEWPNDDAGRDDLWLAVHSLTTVGKDDLAVRSFIKPRVPWLPEREITEGCSEEFPIGRGLPQNQQ